MPISNFEGSGPPVDEARLRALEEQLEIKLPPPYRAFLLRVNGGQPTPEEAFPACSNPDGGSLLSLFFSVDLEDEYDTLAHQRFVFRGRIPVDLLSIGCDQGGNHVCIGIGDNNYGKVYLWLLYDELDLEDGEKPGYDNVYLMAEDFDAFLDSFYDIDDEPL